MTKDEQQQIMKMFEIVMNEMYMPVLRENIYQIVNEKQPLLLTQEKQQYLSLLIEAARSNHACHKEISDVIEDLHKSYGYTQ